MGSAPVTNWIPLQAMKDPEGFEPEAAMWSQLLAARRRITELEVEVTDLKAQVAAFTAENAAVPETPKHNPFRAFPGDRRRVGG